MSRTIQLIEQATCPHCWHRFAPHEALFVARHSDLLGDAVAGDAAFLRFLPSRFTREGNAIDPAGAECRELACPTCHLEVTRAILEMPAMFASIIGAPASGKSYYLAAMTWQLRSVLPKFGWNFVDADSLVNERLHQNEQRLFLNDRPERPIALDKTPTEGGDLYRTVRVQGRMISYPRPFQFVLVPRSERDRGIRRVMVLYDNAGEHFLPGQESGAAPMTEHLGRSKVLMFLLDPTQDPRMRAICRSDDPQLRAGPRGTGFAVETARQETVLAEVGQRIRRSLGLAHDAKHKAPLIVILAKADLWEHHVGSPLAKEPMGKSSSGRLKLDVTKIREVSDQCRRLLLRVCPEFVSAAEWLSRSVLFIPVSALGRSPELVQTSAGSEMIAIRPADVKPRWVTVPLLCALQSMEPGRFTLNAVPAEDPAEAGAEPQQTSLREMT